MHESFVAIARSITQPYMKRMCRWKHACASFERQAGDEEYAIGPINHASHPHQLSSSMMADIIHHHRSRASSRNHLAARDGGQGRPVLPRGNQAGEEMKSSGQMSCGAIFGE